MLKKYKVLLTLFLVAIAGITFLFYRMYQHDIETLESFIVSYKNSEKAISEFSVPVFESNLNDIFNLNQEDKTHNQTKDSTQNTGDKYVMVKEAMSLNTQLLSCLNKTGELERKADNAVRELKLKSDALSGVSSLIKNDMELRNTAAEITNLSEKEFDNLKVYKQVVLDRRNKADSLLRKAIEDKKQLNVLISYFNQKGNPANISIRDSNLEILFKEFKNLNNSRKNAYAHFLKAYN